MSLDGPRFGVCVELVDKEDTNDEGHPRVYRSVESLTETEFRAEEYTAIEQSAAWQLSERVTRQWREVNDE